MLKREVRNRTGGRRVRSRMWRKNREMVRGAQTGGGGGGGKTGCKKRRRKRDGGVMKIYIYAKRGRGSTLELEIGN